MDSLKHKKSEHEAPVVVHPVRGEGLALTVPASNLGIRDLSHACVIFLTPTTGVAIADLQARLRRSIGKGLWTMPPTALHVTVQELDPGRDAPDTNRRQAFESNRLKFVNIIGDALRNLEPFEIRFTTVRVSRDAIFLEGTDDGTLADIRSQLVARLHDEVKAPPRIVHCTIARFSAPLPIESVERLVAGHTIDLVESVEEVAVIRNRVAPVLEYDVVASFALNQARGRIENVAA
jgi:hypothetical protein